MVGAVTHVFISDPLKGYAIFAQTMVKTERDHFEQNSLPKAS
ncbi:MAG: hypothetical protein K6F09_03535 [Clostridiales bacterium]|nr:hypothetical protein [Clostridiales bacterium]